MHYAPTQMRPSGRATEVARPGDASPAMLPQMLFGRALNDGAPARSQMRLSSVLNQSPAMIAQRQLAATLSQRLPQQYQPLRSAIPPDMPGSAAPVQAKILYPLPGYGAPITDRKSLISVMLQRFGRVTTPTMLQRYVDGLDQQQTNYSDFHDIGDAIDTRVKYDTLGGHKWREFVDFKDHAAAEQAVKRGEIDHPGKYYDSRRIGKEVFKPDPHFRSFMDADAFVSDHLNTRLSATEYFHIQRLASQGMSGFYQGVRDTDAAWSLGPETTQEQLSELKTKGLTNVNPDKERGGYNVGVPVPHGGIQKFVQAQLDHYYSVIDDATDGTTRLSAIIALYESLEALHAFKDATSRTNHLVLNKLLAENGLEPAVLNGPNSPTTEHFAFGRHVLEGIQHSRDVATTTPDRLASIESLAGQRNERDEQEFIENETARRFRGKREDARPTFPGRSGNYVAPFSSRLDQLIARDHEHIPPSPISERATAIEAERALEDQQFWQQRREEAREKAARSGPSNSDALETGAHKKVPQSAHQRLLTDQRFNKRARLWIGDRRVDEYLKYKNSKENK